MTPEDLAKAGTEHSHQCALFCWAALNFNVYPELRSMFAIPNGGKRDKITAAHLKAEGVKAGTPDIMLPVARCGHHGLFIELKVGNNKPSDAQNETLSSLRLAGYFAVWVIGWEAARELILQYLKMEPWYAGISNARSERA